MILQDMKFFYLSALSAVVCFAGCGGGGGGAVVEEPYAVVPESCITTEMSFQFAASAADEKELTIEKIVFTEAAPGAQFGSMQVTFRFTNETAPDVHCTLSGEWATAAESTGHIFIRDAVTQTGVDVTSQATVRMEAYHLKLRVDSTLTQADGLAASREATLVDGYVRLLIDGTAHTFHAAGENVRISYRN